MRPGQDGKELPCGEWLWVKSRSQGWGLRSSGHHVEGFGLKQIVTLSHQDAHFIPAFPYPAVLSILLFLYFAFLRKLPQPRGQSLRWARAVEKVLETWQELQCCSLKELAPELRLPTRSRGQE